MDGSVRNSNRRRLSDYWGKLTTNSTDVVRETAGSRRPGKSTVRVADQFAFVG